MAKNTKPTIRFKGFTDDWEQREFDDFFEYIPHNSLSRDNLNYDEGEVKNIHYGDVLIKFGEALNPTIEKIPFVNKDIKFDDKSCFLQDGDIVIADAAEDLTVGKCTEISNGCNQKLVAGLHTIPCRPKNKIEEGFLGFYLNSKAYHNQLLPLIQGTKVSSISKSSLKETWVTFPFSSNEQKKIGSFFLTLNNLITLHQRKYDSLVNVKKAMFEKMFPKNGETVPEIRFKGFTDTWEQRKLSELAEFNPKCNLPNSFEYVDLESVVGTEMISSRFEIKENAPSRAQRLAKKGDVFYQTVRPYQRNNYLFDKEENNYVFSTGYAQLRPNCNSRYLLNLLQTDSFVNIILNNCTGTSYPAINSSDLGNINVITTKNIREQTKIGEIFYRLDNLITLHQRRLEKLKNIKKSCLEKMFI